DVYKRQLYDWERNNLISIPRRPDNGYRVYGAHEMNRLRVIRMLRKARFANMAILRVMTHLDSGRREDLKTVLDTPMREDDCRMPCFSDNWLSTLMDSEKCAREAVNHLEQMVKKYA
ncbi:MAG: MerR family transcriptional regulator, partial [Clostridia bacterium]|nr:MerR family transcriptional regulator [Clostridia bacterium]